MGVLGRNDLRKSLDSMRQNAFDGLSLSPMAQRTDPITPTLHHSSILWDGSESNSFDVRCWTFDVGR